MGEWSLSSLIVAGIALATIIGQAIVVLSRLKTITERLEKRMDKRDETQRQRAETFCHALERLENRMDKRLSDMPTETNYRFTEMNQRFSDIQAEIGDVRSEMNQRLSEMTGEIGDVRSEINQRLSEMTTEVRQLNQNHIDHLNRHHE